jgi:hypothetical protein
MLQKLVAEVRKLRAALAVAATTGRSEPTPIRHT